MEETNAYIEEINFQEYWLILRRRWLPATLILVGSTVLATVYALRQVPIYQATGRLLFQSNTTTSLTGADENIGQLRSLYSQNNPLDTQAVLLESEPIVLQAIERLNLREDDVILEEAPDRFFKGLEIKGESGTDVLIVTFKDSEPELTAAFVNQLMQAYIENDIRNNRLEISAAREFIDQELPRAETEVNQISEELRQFKIRNNIVELQEEAVAIVSNLSTLATDINRTNADLASAETRSIELINQLQMTPDQAADLSNLSQAPGVQQALSQLQDVQTQLAYEQSRYTASHPIVANLQRQEQAAANLLQERVTQILGRSLPLTPGDLQAGTLQQSLTESLIESELNRLSLVSRINALREAQAAYLAWSNQFPNLEKEQRQLQNRLIAAQTIYEDLLRRQQQIQMLENQTVSNAQIIEEAKIPEFSNGENKKIYIVLGMGAGLSLGIAAAFILDLLDRSVKSINEAEAIFGYSLLGLIPKYEPDFFRPAQPWPVRENLLASDNLSAKQFELSPQVTSAYQLLQANLQFSGLTQQAKTILITSATAGEGKSSVAAHLAWTMAQSGRQVLLIDANLRSPHQQYRWPVTHQVGLSHVLQEECHLSEVLQPINEQLTLITAGAPSRQPMALIDSIQMRDLLRHLARSYDAIIMDTPPLLGAAEIAILGGLVDGVIVVVSPRLVAAANAKAAKSLLDRSGANVMGLVANNVNPGLERSDYTPYIPPPTEPIWRSPTLKLRSLISRL